MFKTYCILLLAFAVPLSSAYARRKSRDPFYKSRDLFYDTIPNEKDMKETIEKILKEKFSKGIKRLSIVAAAGEILDIFTSMQALDQNVLLGIFLTDTFRVLIKYSMEYGFETATQVILTAINTIYNDKNIRKMSLKKGTPNKEQLNQLINDICNKLPKNIQDDAKENIDDICNEIMN